MDHPVAVCTSTVSKKRKIVWELESLNLIPIILDEEILVIKVEAYPTFYQTYFYQLTWFWHLGYKISLSVMDALTVMLFLPRCNPLPRIWMMRSGAALAKSALTCLATYCTSRHSELTQENIMKHSEPVNEIRWSLTRENSSKTQIFLTRINILTLVDQYGNLRPGPAKDVHYHTSCCRFAGRWHFHARCCIFARKDELCQTFS